MSVVRSSAGDVGEYRTVNASTRLRSSLHTDSHWNYRRPIHLMSAAGWWQFAMLSPTHQVSISRLCGAR